MAARIMVGAPVVSRALAVYPIRRVDNPRDVPLLLTLPEAIDGGHAVVHETGRVQQLAVKVIGDMPVLCLVGDLVIGGRQDRLVGADALIMRRSGQVRLPAYCVERERWRRRGVESAARFGSSTRAAPSSLRHLLVRGTASQEVVWQQVDELQATLSRASSAGASIRDVRSRTSLALSLARPELGRDLQELVKPLMAVADEHVVGHAVVIGGRLSHAELLGSSELHGRVFQRLIESAAIDALAQPPSAALPEPDEVADWLQAAFDLPAAVASPLGAAWTTTRRGEDVVGVETHFAGMAEPLHVLVTAC